MPFSSEHLTLPSPGHSALVTSPCPSWKEGVYRYFAKYLRLGYVQNSFLIINYSFLISHFCLFLLFNSVPSIRLFKTDSRMSSSATTNYVPGSYPLAGDGNFWFSFGAAKYLFFGYRRQSIVYNLNLTAIPSAPPSLFFKERGEGGVSFLLGNKKMMCIKSSPNKGRGESISELPKANSEKRFIIVHLYPGILLH